MSKQYRPGELHDGADAGLFAGGEMRAGSLGERAAGREPRPSTFDLHGTSDELEPIDPIPELEQQLLDTLHAGLSEQSDMNGSSITKAHLASSSSADRAESGDQLVRTAASLSERPRDETRGSRGSANFQAWLETRRKLDGDDAAFVVEYRGDDGQVSRVDLMRVKYEDLPAPIRAEFERRKFPDLSALIDASSPIRLDQTRSAEVKPRSVDYSSAESELGQPATQEGRAPQIEKKEGPERDEDAADAIYGRPRYGSGPGGPGFGVNFGGLARGAQRAAQSSGRVASETGRAAVHALSGMREGLGLAGGKPREWVGKHVQTWRERRANQALEKLAHTQAEFDTAIRLAHDDPELKKHFRSWNVPRTAATRERAVQRFHEALASGSLSEQSLGHIRGLFEGVETLRVEATRALQRVQRAGHSVEDVQRGLAAWLKRMSERVGPLTNIEGESLGEKLMQMADAIGRLFEQVADRIARLTAVRPT